VQDISAAVIFRNLPLLHSAPRSMYIYTSRWRGSSHLHIFFASSSKIWGGFSPGSRPRRLGIAPPRSAEYATHFLPRFALIPAKAICEKFLAVVLSDIQYFAKIHDVLLSEILHFECKIQKSRDRNIPT
jgi:hypothetical protein